MATKKTKTTVKKTKRTKPAKKAKVLEIPEIKAPAAPEITKEKGTEEKDGVWMAGETVKSAEESHPEVTEGEAEEKRERTGPEKYYEAVGRRKEAIARVRVYTRKSTDAQVSDDKAIITIDDKPYFEYFRDPRLQVIVESPLKKLKSLNRFKATVKLYGGGARGQADAIKLGLSRALVLFDTNFSKKLRKAGYLTRDARVKERRKYGLKKARKSGQWAKR
jgi:small subunit ribosomal protein S9